jgi:hypothetical protein
MRRLLFFFLLQSSASEIYCQAFLNGSFENNTVTDCMIDINNSTFNSVMSDVKAIGGLEYLDILFYDSCQYFPPENGSYCSTLETYYDSTTSTALNFPLASALPAFVSCTISFYYRINPGTTPGNHIEIGYSTNDSTFGTLVYSSPLFDTIWTKVFVTFIPTVNTQYITAREQPGNLVHGEFVDNFSFDTTGMSAIAEEQELSFTLYPNPTTKNFTVNNIHSTEKLAMEVIDIFGEVVYSEQLFGRNEFKIDANLASGIYFVSVRYKEKNIVQKLIIE